jgi:hypothetical protein
MSIPARGPNIAAKTVKTAMPRLRFVFGTPEGMATKRMRTKKRAAPIPIATTVLTEITLLAILNDLLMI